MRKAVIVPLLLISLLLGLSSTPLATAQQLTIKPGGVYTIYVPVHKPSSLRLLEGTWEIRVYFYDSINCYNTGYWWQSGSDWIYSGWYGHRYLGDDWSGGPEDKTFNITVTLVSESREQEDIDRGMNNIPVPGNVTLRTRLVIKDIGAEFAPVGEGESGYVTFTIGGFSYRHLYTVDQYGDIHITGEGFEAKIDQDTEGKYRLLIDQKVGVAVSNDVSSTGIYTMPVAINANLLTTSQTEQPLDLPFELKVAIGVVTVMAVVGGVAYLGLRGRKPAEELEPI